MRPRPKYDEPCSSRDLQDDTPLNSPIGLQVVSSRAAAMAAAAALTALAENDDTDSTQSPASPKSPIGRVAKRNARLFNGLDLGSKTSGVFAAHCVGTIRDFSFRALPDVAPTIVKFLKDLETNPENFCQDDDALFHIQLELESLLAENVDFERTIFGEITFLNTGDYPTADLQSRPMPTYEMRKVGSRRNSVVEVVEKPSSSRAQAVIPSKDDEDAGSDVVSSTEEIEEPPYSILDVPHRFWVWSREYIGHVNEDFLNKFKENFHDRYSLDKNRQSFENEPYKYRKAGPGAVKINKHKKLGRPRKDDPRYKNSAEGTTELVKRMVAAMKTESNQELKKSPKRTPSPEKHIHNALFKRRRSSMKSEGTPSANTESSEGNTEITNDVCEAITNIMSECVLSNSGTNSSIISRTDNGLSDSEESQKPEVQADFKYEYAVINPVGKTKHDSEALDEVSAALLAEQQKLERLLKKVAPSLDKAKSLLESDHAHWITSRALSKADDEFFRAAAQVPSNIGDKQASPNSAHTAALRRCNHAWHHRRRCLFAHHIRDHMKWYKTYKEARRRHVDRNYRIQKQQINNDESNEMLLEMNGSSESIPTNIELKNEDM